MNRQQAKPKGFVQNQSLTPQPRGSEYAIDDDPNQSAGKNILSMTSLNKFHVRRPAELKVRFDLRKVCDGKLLSRFLSG